MPRVLKALQKLSIKALLDVAVETNYFAERSTLVCYYDTHATSSIRGDLDSYGDHSDC